MIAHKVDRAMSHRESTSRVSSCPHGLGETEVSVPAIYSWPQSAIMTCFEVLPDCEPTASIDFTTSKPSTTRPNTTCLPSSLQTSTRCRCQNT